MLENKFLELLELSDVRSKPEPQSLRQAVEERLLVAHKASQAMEQAKREKPLRAPKFAAADYVGLAAKALEDLCANMEENIEIQNIIYRIKRQKQTDPENREYDSLLKKSKSSVKNNTHQRQLIKTFIGGLVEDCGAALSQKEVR